MDASDKIRRVQGKVILRDFKTQLAKQPNMGGVDMEYTPVLDASEQRTLMA